MSNSVIVLTGCTAGLGLKSLIALSNKPESFAFIILACRDVKSANNVADDVSKKYKISRDKLIVLDDALDLSELASVRSFASSLISRLKADNKRISTLINNAGIGGSPKFSKNSQGYEKIFTTNHLGHFLLSILLLPYIDQRIVNVASEVHDPATKTGLPDPEEYWPTNAEQYDRHLLRGEPFEGENDFKSGGRRYSRSKLCNILFTYKLASKLSGDLPAYIVKFLSIIINHN